MKRIIGLLKRIMGKLFKNTIIGIKKRIIYQGLVITDLDLLMSFKYKNVSNNPDISELIHKDQL